MTAQKERPALTPIGGGLSGGPSTAVRCTGGASRAAFAFASFGSKRRNFQAQVSNQKAEALHGSLRVGSLSSTPQTLHGKSLTDKSLFACADIRRGPYCFL